MGARSYGPLRSRAPAFLKCRERRNAKPGTHAHLWAIIKTESLKLLSCITFPSRCFLLLFFFCIHCCKVKTKGHDINKHYYIFVVKFWKGFWYIFNGGPLWLFHKSLQWVFIFLADHTAGNFLPFCLTRCVDSTVKVEAQLLPPSAVKEEEIDPLREQEELGVFQMEESLVSVREEKEETVTPSLSDSDCDER